MHGVKRSGIVRWPYSRATRLDPLPFSSNGSGGSQVSPGPYLGSSSATAGQSLGMGGSLGIQGTGHVPPVATVATSAPSATTDQSPVRAKAQSSPQVY